MQEILNTLTLEDVGDASVYYLARHTAQTIGDVLYRFTEMKSERKDSRMPLKKVGLSVAESRRCRQGDARRTTWRRDRDRHVARQDLGNLPPNVCTPTYLGRAAQKLAKGNAS